MRGSGVTTKKDWNKEIKDLLDRIHAFTLVAETWDDGEEEWKSDEETPDWVIARMVGARVEAKADQGNFEPMRRAISRVFGRDWIRFLRRPPGSKRGRPLKVDSSISRAVDDYGDVMAHYKGTKSRPKGAIIEKIVADRYGVDPRQVQNQLKKKQPRRIFPQ